MYRLAYEKYKPMCCNVTGRRCKYFTNMRLYLMKRINRTMALLISEIYPIRLTLCEIPTIWRNKIWLPSRLYLLKKIGEAIFILSMPKDSTICGIVWRSSATVTLLVIVKQRYEWWWYASNFMNAAYINEMAWRWWWEASFSSDDVEETDCPITLLTMYGQQFLSRLGFWAHCW